MGNYRLVGTNGDNPTTTFEEFYDTRAGVRAAIGQRLATNWLLSWMSVTAIVEQSQDMQELLNFKP